MTTILLSFEDLRSRGWPKSKAQTNRDIKAGKFPKPLRLGKTPAWPESVWDAFIRDLMAGAEKQ